MNTRLELTFIEVMWIERPVIGGPEDEAAFLFAPKVVRLKFTLQDRRHINVTNGRHRFRRMQNPCRFTSCTFRLIFAVTPKKILPNPNHVVCVVDVIPTQSKNFITTKSGEQPRNTTSRNIGSPFDRFNNSVGLQQFKQLLAPSTRPLRRILDFEPVALGMRVQPKVLSLVTKFSAEFWVI